MPALLPRLDTRFGGAHLSENFCGDQSVPVNGANVYTLPYLGQGIPASGIQAEYLQIWVFAKGPSVTNAVFVSLAPDKTSITINITQIGADQAEVVVENIHTIRAGF